MRRHIQHGRGGSFKFVINEKELSTFLSMTSEEIDNDKDDAYNKLRDKISQQQKLKFNGFKAQS